MKKNRFIIVVFVAVFSVISFAATQKKTKPENQKNDLAVKSDKKALNFFVISDWGWNGFKDQQIVADQMGLQADKIHPQFIVSCGDNFQVAGVASTQDPLWTNSFENVYKSLSLMVDWYPVLGNHDYKGNTQAEIDYSHISRRWRMKDHYYTFARKINDSISARFIFLDTPPLVEEYHKGNGYPDVAVQDTAKQIQWLNDVLANSTEQWKLVFGHHPVYSASKTHGNTPEMIQKVKPLLEKYHAQFYFCGHDHDFQHLREKGKDVDYVVTGTGGEPRPCSMDEHSIYSHSAAGFSEVTFHADSIRVIFMGASGEAQYAIERAYR
ncbi:MAG: metallophosphoesterase [Bacteroidota bacterium]|nr:metallophosphoesterase [Bacteroidota bacterium]